jgi:hypothetical protein
MYLRTLVRGSNAITPERTRHDHPGVLGFRPQPKLACQDSGAIDAMTTIETRTSWVVAFTALGVMSIAYGAPFVAMVALKQIAGENSAARVRFPRWPIRWHDSAPRSVASAWGASRIASACVGLSRSAH